MRALHKVTQELLAEALQDVDVQATGYSGRGMMGRMCLGIIGSDPALYAVQERLLAGFLDVARFASEDERTQMLEDGAELFLEPRRDSLGYERVLYWPELEPLEQA